MARLVLKERVTPTEDPMTPRSLVALSLIGLPLLTACPEKGGDDTGGDNAWMPYCEATETPLAFDEASPLGFSGADLTAAIGSTASAPLAWVDPVGTTTLELSLAWSSAVTFVDLEEATPPDDATAIADIAVICDDYLVVGATLGLTSADGLLADSFAIDLSATAANAGSFALELETADFSHPEIFAAFEDATPGEGSSIDDQHPRMSGSFSAGGGSQGELAWIAEGSGEGTAWQSQSPVATWGSEAE